GPEHRAGAGRLVASPGGVRRGRVPDGLPQDPRAVLEIRRTARWWPRLDRRPYRRRRCRRPLGERRAPTGRRSLMAKQVKVATRTRAAAKPRSPQVGAGELVTLFDFVRYAVSRFNASDVVFAHGTTDAVAEAAFIVTEALHLHPDQFEMFATARVTEHEGARILELIEQRISTRKPAAYLLNRIYMRGVPFYVDERVIVPRSFIGELLESHFDGG